MYFFLTNLFFVDTETIVENSVLGVVWFCRMSISLFNHARRWVCHPQACMYTVGHRDVTWTEVFYLYKWVREYMTKEVGLSLIKGKKRNILVWQVY